MTETTESEQSCNLLGMMTGWEGGSHVNPDARVGTAINWVMMIDQSKSKLSDINKFPTSWLKKAEVKV